MVVIIVTNSQIGFSCIERNGIWASNYRHNFKNSCGFLIYRKPIFGISAKGNKVKQSHILSSRELNYGAISALLKEGLGNGGITEKEFEFKPSFDEYLKAMESVKSDRQMPQAPNSTKSKYDKGEKGALRTSLSSSKRNLENSKLRERDFVSNREAPDVDNIQKLKDATKMEIEVKRVPNNLYVNKEKIDTKVFKRKLSSDNERQMNRTFEERNFKADNLRYGTSGRYEKDHFQEEKVPYKRNAKNLEPNESFKPILDESSNYKKFKDEKGPYKRNMKNLEANKSFKPILDESSDDESGSERAAFKSLDFSSAYDQPRVSRVDMEERIQRLAKCLNGADINMPEWMFSKMMRSARIRFSDHSVLRVIQILGQHGNWRRVLQVIEWMESRERFKSHKLRHIYTAALDALGKARRPVEALNVFHTMQKQMSSYPDLVAYHCIAVTLGQAGHMKELFDVVDIMRSPPKKKFKSGILQHWDPRLEPDMVVYNAVLNACVRRKNWEGAFWVLQQLKQQGQQASTATYGLVMEVMFSCGKYNLVHEFFRKMQKSSIPNALTYKVLVNTLWKEGKIEEAILAVRDMERRGIIGSAGLYYDLARCLCSAGRSQEALKQMDKICRVANKPLVVTYTGLIQACLDAGKIESGAYIFNHMHKYCSPNLVTCNIILKGYLDHEMFNEAIELFDKLAENVNRISNTLDYKDKVIPDIYTFNLILDACALKNMWDDFGHVYKMMLQRGFHFNPKRHLRLILDASRAGKVDLLEITWKHLVNWDQTPPPLLIKEIFRFKLEQDDYVAALSCISGLSLSESKMFSSKSWSNFFRENQHCFDKETIIRLVHEISGLISKSDTHNLVFKNLVSSCKEILRSQFRIVEIDQTETVSRLKLDNSVL